MERTLIMLWAFLIGGCATQNHHASQDTKGITVDYLGRNWPPSYQGYVEKPNSVPDYVVKAEMRHYTLDAGVSDPRWLYLRGLENDEVIIARSFTPVLSVAEMPVKMPKDLKFLLKKTINENREFRMSNIPWPFAPPSHAYILLSENFSELISLTRFDNAFVLQHAFIASASYEEMGRPPEFQATGAWSTWIESPELAEFLDKTFKHDTSQTTPFAKWLSDNTGADRKGSNP